MRRLLRDRKGAALAEYGLLLAGITMVSLVAVSVLGGKVAGLVGAIASVLPGAMAQQNAPVYVGQLIETRTANDNGDHSFEQKLDMVRITDQNQNTPRLGATMGLDAHGSSHLYQFGSDENPFPAQGSGN
jgi:Flp pilus assembly pilin Flp